MPIVPRDFNECRALVEQVAGYAMVVLDLSGRVRSWNRGAQRLVGYTPEQITGRHFSVCYLPEDIQSGKPARDLEAARVSGHLEEEGFRARADGTRFWAFVSITLLRDDSGEPRGFAEVTRDLGERRSAEEELRRSEERFRLLVEGVTDYAIYLLDLNGDVVTWNAGAERIKGYGASEIVGRNFSVFFTAEDQAAGRPRAELQVALDEGRFAEEGWRVRADGSRFWASVVVTALRDTRGAPVGFSKVTRDLTARKQAEETARELQEQHLARVVAEAREAHAKQDRERFRLLSEQLEVILEGVVDGITVQDRSGAVIFANTAAARLTGLKSREELVSRPPAELLHRFEMLDEFGAAFPLSRLPGRRVLAGEKQASALLRVRDKLTGHQWWSQVRSNAVLAEDGTPELAINIWHDVSQQRRQEEHDRYVNEVTAALSRSLDYEATLNTLVNLLVPGLADWCAIHLLEGSTLRTVAVSHAEPGTGDRLGEHQNQYLPHGDDTSALWQVIRGGRPLLREQAPEASQLSGSDDAERPPLLSNVGTRSLIFVPIKVRDQVSGTLSLIAAESGRRYDERDLALVTELGRRVGNFIENALLYERAQGAAQRAEAAAREAEAAGRLKDEFLATVSHELRTPLNAIVGWSSLLQARSVPSSVAKGLEVIHRNATAQSKIIEDILDVSRIINGKLRLELRATDLCSIVSDALEAVRPSAEAREITLIFSRPSSPAALVGDAERLQQVMWNLLSNAVKFSERGGRVEVRVQRVASQLDVSVADDGKGIAPEFLPYVFDRFKQADSSTTRRFGGLGLGLAIVRHIVELHGGRAAVESPGLGKGSTFTFSLPIHATAALSLAPSGAPVAPSVSTPLPKVRLDGVRVLVVDDEPDARDLLELVLSDVGAQVTSAGTAEEAFAALGEQRPHVIVSDIGMPEEDGYSLMSRVRLLAGPSASIPAIALTAYTRNEDRLKALAMGFSAHLGKPVSSLELVELVAVLARRGH